MHTAHTERKDVFDYSDETIRRFTRRIKPKSLAFDDQVRIHHHSVEQENQETRDDENSGEENE